MPVVVLSSPSGGGKSTIAGYLQDKFHYIQRSISYTTRPPRLGEKNGIDYHFVSEDEFFQKKDKNFFIETVQVYNYFYGTPFNFIENTLKKGLWPLLLIDGEGFLNIKDHYEHIESFFIIPPSKNILKKRLLDRQDSMHIIDSRMAEYDYHMSFQNHYKHVIVNDILDKCVTSIENILKMAPTKKIWVK